RLNLLNRYGLLRFLDFHQAAKGRHVAVLVINQRSVLFVSLVTVGPHSVLQLADAQWIQQVIFAVYTEVVAAADGKFGIKFSCRLECVAMLHDRFARKYIQAYALKARSGPGEISVHEIFVQADR